jgi:hypothetical protein
MSTTLPDQEYPASLSDSLRHRLLEVEGDLLAAIRAGDDISLARFADHWAALALEIENATPELDASTLDLAQRTATSVEILAENFALLYESIEEISTRLHSELESYEGARRDAQDGPVAHVRQKPYIVPAFRWLHANLHNPYPSKRTREKIAKESKSREKDVRNWFGRARQRIGWNALCRKHFQNSRINTVQAAYRAFVEDDPRAPLAANILDDFIQVEKEAKGMYSDCFQPTFDIHTQLGLPTVNGTRQRASDCAATRQPVPELTKVNSFEVTSSATSNSPIFFASRECEASQSYLGKEKLTE